MQEYLRCIPELPPDIHGEYIVSFPREFWGMAFKEYATVPVWLLTEREREDWYK